MTPAQIRAAACLAFDGGPDICINTVLFTEAHLRQLEAVYRAGMEAGRAEAAAAKPKRRKTEPCSVLRPLTVDEQTWADWVTLRKTKKAAVTQTVLNAACREATKAGMSLEDFLRVWCFRGSQGLEAAWLTPAERGSGPRAGRMDRQLETAALMTGTARSAPADMGEIYDVGQQRIAGR